MARKIGNGSSKYDYGHRCLDTDINDKLEVAAKFKEDVEKLIEKEYRYHKDEGSMSKKWKIEKIKEILIELIGGDK